MIFNLDNLDNLTFTPTGKPFEYSPKSYFILDEIAEEINRLTGIDGLSILKVMFCEIHVFEECENMDRRTPKLEKLISDRIGVPIETITQVLDTWDDIICKSCFGDGSSRLHRIAE